MLVTLLAVPAATHYFTRRMTPVYEAKSRLLIESSIPAVVPAGLAGLLSGVSSSPLDVEVEKMKSRTFLTEVAKTAKVSDPPEALLGKLVFMVKAPAPIVEVSARASTGKDAAGLANAVLSVYRRSVDREADSKSGQAAVKLRAATRKLEEEKQAATRAVENFARQMGISDPGVNFNLRTAKTAQVRAELEEARKQDGILESGIAEAQRQMSALRSQKVIVTGYPLQKNPLIDSVPLEINNKLSERKLTLEDFQPDSPEVQRIDAEIKALKEKLDRARKESYSVGSKGVSLNPDFQAAQSRWWNLQQDRQTNARRIRESTAQLASLQSEQRTLTELRTRYEQLKRTEGRANALYEEARVGEIKAQMAQLTRLPNVRTLDSAQVPDVPISPNPKLNLALAIGLGLLLSLGMGLLAEFLAPAPREPQWGDTQEPLPGLPSVGGVPLLGTAPVATLPAHTTQAPALALGGASAEDALREIGYGLAHRMPGTPAPVALLVGTRTDDSCAALTAYLSALLLRDGLRITLVDADRATPRLHQVFGKPDAPGLADALAGQKIGPLLHRTDDGRFRFLAAGNPDDPTPLTEEGLRKALHELATSENTDLVLVCGPSVWNARAVAPLERAAGGLVLVASPEVPAEESVARARRLLTNGYTPNISGVITHDRPALPSAQPPIS
jgi:polysaccharide biosynthesis transport protein